MKQNNEDKYYRTTHFDLAIFLFTKGMELAGIVPIDDRRCEFAFIDTPEREKLVGAFQFGKENDLSVMVDARKIIFASKNLKNKLYSVLKDNKK